MPNNQDANCISNNVYVIESTTVFVSSLNGSLAAQEPQDFAQYSMVSYYEAL